MNTYSDEEIISGILHQERDIYLYIYNQWFPMIERLVINMNGGHADASDIFQETMIAVIHNVKKKDFKLNCKFRSYLYAIAKKIWMQELKSNYKKYKYNGHIPDIVEDCGQDNDTEKKLINLLAEHFKTLSKDCQKILRMHLNSATIDQITRIMGYKSNHHTMDRKYRCKNSLRKRVCNDPKYNEIKNDLTRQNRSLYR